MPCDGEPEPALVHGSQSYRDLPKKWSWDESWHGEQKAELQPLVHRALFDCCAMSSGMQPAQGQQGMGFALSWARGLPGGALGGQEQSSLLGSHSFPGPTFQFTIKHSLNSQSSSLPRVQHRWGPICTPDFGAAPAPIYCEEITQQSLRPQTPEEPAWHWKLCFVFAIIPIPISPRQNPEKTTLDTHGILHKLKHFVDQA